MKRTLNGMIVAISGASAGIGEALAQQLALRGAKLALSARRLDKLEAVRQQLGPGDHLVYRADVSQSGECEAFIAATLHHFGRIDTLVCNAGYGMYKRVHEFSTREMRDMFATNVFGTTDLIHAATPAMLKQEPRDGWRGQVMIVSSAAARRATPYLGPYSATKAAQLSLAEAMRIELAPEQIGVTSIHPIMTKTEFGRVAEAAGNIKLPRGDAFTQTVGRVVRCMIKAIEKPTAEVWPHWASRWGLGFATLFPRMTDRALHKYRRQIEEVNR